jgi:excisionase family DNA binding protein
MACAWLTIQEAADFLKVHHTTIRRYIRLKKLKVNRPSTHTVRICPEELNNLEGGEK